jgi:zinc D-Ala-D-Ala carboxypeptidase
MMNQLTPHFSLEEFTFTEHRNIDNTLPRDLVPNAISTCQMLERIRTAMSQERGRDIAMFLTSGYRCTQLNRSVGSSDTSDHVLGLAGDWHAPDFGTPYQICQFLKDHVDLLNIGQLIHEFGRWVHTGNRRPSNPINRVITIDGQGTRAGILMVR